MLSTVEVLVSSHESPDLSSLWSLGEDDNDEDVVLESSMGSRGVLGPGILGPERGGGVAGVALCKALEVVSSGAPGWGHPAVLSLL